MKVFELIRKLAQHNPQAEVGVVVKNGKIYPVAPILSYHGSADKEKCDIVGIYTDEDSGDATDQ